MSTPAAQPAIMQLNDKAVRTADDLKAALDTLAPGAAVTITFASKGRNLAIEGTVKER